MSHALPSWLRPATPGWLLELHVQPGARVTEVQGLHGTALKLRLAAPPVDGKANQELVRFIARTIGVGRSDVELVSGQTSRQKRVRIKNDLPATAVISALWDDSASGWRGRV